MSTTGFAVQILFTLILVKILSFFFVAQIALFWLLPREYVSSNQVSVSHFKVNMSKIHPIPTPNNAVTYKTCPLHSENRKRSNNNVFSRMRHMLHIRFVHREQQRARPHNQFYSSFKVSIQYQARGDFHKNIATTNLHKSDCKTWVAHLPRSFPLPLALASP